MIRCLHGLAPEYLYLKFTWRDSAYDLRDSENKLNVPLSRTNYYRKGFNYNGATLWNSLPCLWGYLSVRSMTFLKSILTHGIHGKQLLVLVYSLNFKYFSMFDMYFYGPMNWTWFCCYSYGAPLGGHFTRWLPFSLPDECFKYFVQDR